MKSLFLLVVPLTVPITAATAAPADVDLKYEAKPRERVIDWNGRLIVATKLTNRGQQPVTVYWGDSALPDMYRFDIRHRETDERIPTTRLMAWDVELPRAADKRRFVVIEPGKSVSYDVYLFPQPGSNAQRVYFHRPGKYVIRPSLNIQTDHSIDRKTGVVKRVNGVWTGLLKAAPFPLRVREPDKESPSTVELTGTVVDDGGQPIKEGLAQVFARRTSVGYGRGFVEQLVGQATIREGRFVVCGLPMDKSSWQVRAWSSGRAMAVTDVLNDGKNATPVCRLALKKGTTLRGRVVDEDGQPIPFVRVAGRTQTNEKGQFRLRGFTEAESYHISFWRPGFLDKSQKATHIEATQGDWTIALNSRAAAQVAGTIRFPDGSVVANAKIKFDLQPLDPNKNSPYRPEVETNPDGQFKLELPEPAAYNGTVSAFEPAEYNIGRIWRSEPARIEPGKPFNAVVDNRHRLSIKITHANELPKDLELIVQCQLDRRRTMQVQRVAANAEMMTFDRLTPGDYDVSVSIGTAEHLNWRSSSTIPVSAKPEHSTVSISIPELHFGGIKAKFVMPDGETPLASSRIWIDSSGGWGSYQTDEDGVLEITTLPVGSVFMTPRGIADVAEVPFKARVERGVTDLGTYRAKRVDEEFGWVTGKFMYDDGRPVLGARAVGTGVGLSTMTTILPSGFQAAKVNADGSFEVRLPKGHHQLKFELAGAAGWVGAQTGQPLSTFQLFGQAKGFLHAFSAIKVEPGKTLDQQIVLRRPSKKRDLTIHLDGADKASLLATTIVAQDDVRLAHTAMTGPKRSQELTASDLPPGKCIVVCRGTSLPYFAINAVDTSVDKPATRFSIQATREIEVHVVDEDGEPQRDIGITVSTDILGQTFNACVLQPEQRGETHVEPRRHRAIQPLDDGGYRVVGLGTGQYRVTVSSPGWSLSKDVELKAGKRVQLRWTRSR